MTPRHTRSLLVLALLTTVAGLAGVLIAKRPTTLFLLDNLHWTASHLAATLLVFQRWARTTDPALRKGLAWCLAGVGSMLLGQILQDAMAWTRWQPIPYLTDAFFLACGPCLTIGLVNMTQKRLKPDDWRAVALDSAGILVATLVATLALFMPRQPHGPDQPGSDPDPQTSRSGAVANLAAALEHRRADGAVEYLESGLAEPEQFRWQPREHGFVHGGTRHRIRAAQFSP